MNALSEIISQYKQLFIDVPLFFFAVNVLLGLCAGSFLNVVAIRTLAGESVVYPPSHCPNCSHRLTLIDLIPVFSYLVLGRKCRYCKQPISARYAVWEAAAGFLFGAAGAFSGPTPEWPVALLLVSVLIVIVQTDLQAMIIPDKVLLFGAAAGFLLRCWSHPLPVLHYIYGLLLGGGLLFLIAFASSVILKKEAMGGGDIKLLGFIGMLLGVKLTLLTLFLACLAGTVLSVALIALRLMKKDQYVPFGPYIALGALLSYWFGNDIWDAYLSLLY